MRYIEHVITKGTYHVDSLNLIKVLSDIAIRNPMFNAFQTPFRFRCSMCWWRDVRVGVSGFIDINYKDVSCYF